MEQAAFEAAYPGESYGDYLAEQTLLQSEMVKQSLMFIKGYLCTRPVEDNGVFRETFFRLVQRFAVPGVTLSAIIDGVIGEASTQARGDHTAIKKTAYLDLVGMFDGLGV